LTDTPTASTYYCYQVTDSAGVPETAFSATDLVSVNAALVAGGATPVSPTVDAGQSVMLTVHPSLGTSPYAYQWYSGFSTDCASDTPISGATGATLSAAPTVNTYYCYRVTDSAYSPVSAFTGVDLVLVDPVMSMPVVTSSVSSLDLGEAVALSVLVTGGSGTYTYTWTGLPSGCVSSNSAMLTCVPTAVGAGTFSITVTVVDANGVSLTSSPVSVKVSADPTVTAPTATYPSLDVGQSTAFTATSTNGTGGVSVYAWSGLPEGCVSIDSLTLPCTPTAPGEYSVSVSVTDSNGVRVDSVPVILVVSSSLGQPSLAGSVPALDVGQAVTLSVTVSGGSVPYAYAWKGLPTGCANVNSATLLCSPSDAGSAAVSVTVTDANGVALTSALVNLTVSARLLPGSITMSPGMLDLGQTAGLTVSVAGGSGGLSYAWSGLPSGCESADLAHLSCTPGSSGTSWVTVEVTDSNGAAVSAGPMPLTVSPALGTPTILASVTALQVGGSVTFTASVSGGTGPLSYSWTGLPTGCVSANSPTLTCAPSTVGTYSVAVAVTDAAGVTTTATAVSVTVSAATTQSTSTSSGVSGIEWAALSIALVALIIGLVCLLLAFQRRKTGGSPGAEDKPAGKPETPAASSSPPEETSTK
jgi:hypothetical protein